MHPYHFNYIVIQFTIINECLPTMILSRDDATQDHDILKWHMCTQSSEKPHETYIFLSYYPSTARK